MSAIFQLCVFTLAGVALGYGFRGWIRRHLNTVKEELLSDLKVAHDRLQAALPGIEAGAKADIEKAIAAIKRVL